MGRGNHVSRLLLSTRRGRKSGAPEDDTLATKGGLDPKLHPISRSVVLLLLLTHSLLGRAGDHPLITGCPETEFPPLFRAPRPGGHSWVSLGASMRRPAGVVVLLDRPGPPVDRTGDPLCGEFWQRAQHAKRRQ